MSSILYAIYKPVLAMIYIAILVKGCQYIGPSTEASDRRLMDHCDTDAYVK